MRNMYDDFATMNEANCLCAERDYSAKKFDKICKTSQSMQIEKNQQDVLKKIEYLQSIVPKLKNHTTNQDVLLVLDEIDEQISTQKTALENFFEKLANFQQNQFENVQIFCNNLKLAIQTTNEIVELLIKIKDSDGTPGEIRPQITDVINGFLNINNKFVSLFGECRYRNFVMKYGK